MIRVMTAFRPALLLPVCLILQPMAAAAEVVPDRDFARALFQVYGFCAAQAYSIEMIETDHPDIGPDLRRAEMIFRARFRDVCGKAATEVANLAGPEDLAAARADLLNEVDRMIGQRPVTRSVATGFVDELTGRAEGRIPSPALENILALRYQDQPAAEIADGFARRFESAGHPKSRGIHVALELPRSWRQEEGDRPHIVQKWIRPLPQGMTMIHLDIRDAEGLTPTYAELEAEITASELATWVPEGGTFIDGGIFVIENQPAVWFEAEVIRPRVDLQALIHVAQYQVFFRGKVIGVSCQAGDLPERKADVDDLFEALRPVCRQVLNSLVLAQAYTE